MRSHRHTNRTHPANGPAGSLLAGLIFHSGRGREGTKPTGPLLRESIIDRQGERDRDEGRKKEGDGDTAAGVLRQQQSGMT